MTISSVSAPPPVVPVAASPKTPDVTTDAANADAANTNTWQPPAPSPLPPGQGTRIDQLA